VSLLSFHFVHRMRKTPYRFSYVKPAVDSLAIEVKCLHISKHNLVQDLICGNKGMTYSSG
jgi:hypothetical protein